MFRLSSIFLCAMLRHICSVEGTASFCQVRLRMLSCIYETTNTLATFSSFTTMGNSYASISPLPLGTQVAVLKFKQVVVWRLKEIVRCKHCLTPPSIWMVLLCKSTGSLFSRARRPKTPLRPEVLVASILLKSMDAVSLNPRQWELGACKGEWSTLKDAAPNDKIELRHNCTGRFRCSVC